ncbi:MAG: S9 family peptidase [Acidobacteria bacterium]|nr:S9 family peptidase [Acidobacteriota bacterium]
MSPSPAFAQAPDEPRYLLPPKAIVDALDAPPPPDVYLSPARDVVAVLDRAPMPSIADLARPMLRLAGLRIDPKNNGRHRARTARALTLKTVADGAARTVTLPASPALTWIGFSADGQRFAFTHTGDTAIQLWLGTTATGRAQAVDALAVNGVFGAGCTWVGTGTQLLCSTIPAGRGPAPVAPAAPTGPNVQEHRGGVAPVRTYQDLLTSAHDERLFTYHGTSQLVLVNTATLARTPLGRPGLYPQAQPSPDGQHVLVTMLTAPFSRLVPYDDFARTIAVWDRSGAVTKTIATLPVADNIPNGGVPTGPRAVRWQPTAAATLTWAEALDGGNPKQAAPQRDRVVTLAAPFTAAPAELARTEHRFGSLQWTDKGVGLLTENDRTTRRTRTWVLDGAGAEPRKLWDRSAEDSYSHPGTPIRREGASGLDVIPQTGTTIFLAGTGASPQGDKPFLDALDLATLKASRTYQMTEGYEPVVGLLADDGSRVLTRFETKNTPPATLVRSTTDGRRVTLTTSVDPAPGISGAQKQLITYARADGVQLSATLYTPAGWTPEKGRLPMILWAYPREFVDPNAAGQVSGSAQRFTGVSGASHLLLLTQGYAILDDPSMPIVGPGETANNTYVEQLVASAKAAVDKVVAMGVADPNRLVAGGHSYGGFMTANLLAHSDLFRAGIARSGAYNRTLTPFGFQNEQRTFWEVPEIYSRMSPFNHAHLIKEPVLLIHGEADDNSGTFPIQSERFYAALKGHGATARYVTLPHEAHGYAARESVLHTVAEMLNWANEWTKPSAPVTAQPRQ